MTSLRTTLSIAGAIVAGIAAAVVPHLFSRPPGASSSAPSVHMAPAIGMPGAPPTSADGLRQRIAEMESRLDAHPGDPAASLLLADVLLRQARAATDGRAANRAGEVLVTLLEENPGQYDALRLLGAVHLSRHRFRDALEIGRQARDLRPDDAWNYGVIGDALIELGEYDEAFAAFDTMVSMRPSADAYARVSYARELQGDLAGALKIMRLAEDATTSHDLEAKAWYAAHTGELHLRMGKLADAEREYRRAGYLFPEYPHAMVGLGKVKAAQGDDDGALEIFRDQLRRTPTLDLAARTGDIYAARGSHAEAEHYYQLAEHLAGPAAVQTEANLALFLAERDRKVGEAIQIAKAVAAVRHDIFTEDALAWALYKDGRIDEAYAASQRALRTGTADERILQHAAAIRLRKASPSGADPGQGTVVKVTSTQ
jgi:tetratricopeptide (TPR) repeat protein